MCAGAGAAGGKGRYVPPSSGVILDWKEENRDAMAMHFALVLYGIVFRALRKREAGSEERMSRPRGTTARRYGCTICGTTDDVDHWLRLGNSTSVCR